MIMTSAINHTETVEFSNKTKVKPKKATTTKKPSPSLTKRKKVSKK